MKINETLYGFRILREKEIKDISATLYEATHEKSGARLIFLDREDENKTFSITFKTIPEDSTGVFHIIEHSVLCGSRKYTTKEPFVDLLKGSLNTFLNAMTFPDKTMYPVSSRNDKDFLNLTDVYLDAVFHPAILGEENIFRQEGWHYEYNEESGELYRSGVVLSEMQGAFSSPDDVASYHINEMLYKGTPYAFESGGEPGEITKLTYSEFCRQHEKYYHPSNAEIFLDGKVKLDELLPLIDSYLSEYEKKDCDFVIPDVERITPTSRCIDYEISSEEDPRDKTRLVVGYLAGRFDEKIKSAAISVLLDAIASSNDSPLKKAIIDSGLCEDMSFLPLDAIKECALLADFRNVKDGKCDELYGLFCDTVRRIASEGIDRSAIRASINSLEFRMREKDYGTMPTGIIYAMTVLESSLYGGDAAENLSFDEVFTFLREKIDTDYFEKLLLSIFIENTHRATLVMTPDPTLGERRAREEKEALQKIKDSLSEKELLDIIKTAKELKTWQAREDTEEDLMTVPKLSISDISEEPERIPLEVYEKEGVTLLSSDITTNGIVYTDLCFDVSDLTPDEIFKMRLLVSLVENLATEKHTATELQNLIKGELGSFGISLTPLTVRGEKTKMYATVSASALESARMRIADITEEILYTSLYRNRDAVRNVVRQLKIASEESFVSSGHQAAIRRAGAYTNPVSAIQEYYSGYEAHLMIKELERSFDEKFDSLADSLEALAKKAFTKKRLLISTAGARHEDLEDRLLEVIRDGGGCEDQTNVSPFGARREGIVIPAKTSYTAMAGNIYALGAVPHGSMNVVRSLLSYEYLWGAVRVQGGAYGVGLVSRNDGNVGFYSYRDPSPERTLGCFKKSGEFLRDFAKRGEDITKYIIGAIGDASPLTSPKLKGTLATTRYLRGVDHERVCELRREMLSTGAKELCSAADLLDTVTESGAFCVVGSKDKLDGCKDIEAFLTV